MIKKRQRKKTYGRTLSQKQKLEREISTLGDGRAKLNIH